MTETDQYELRERLPTPKEFRTLRAVAGLSPRSREGIERGLPNSLFAAVVVHPEDGTVGMGRAVGDGGPSTTSAIWPFTRHTRGEGVGARIMEAIDAFIGRDAPPGAYLNLMADVEGFDERFGFVETRPASRGVFRRVE